MGNWWRWLGGKVARTTFPRTTIRGGLSQSARLHVEELENRCVPARLGTPLNDADDTIAEAINVGTITDKHSVRRSASLGFATDVDMYRFSVAAGATVEFIVQARAPATDPYLRLFDRRGNELAFNDDGPIPNQPPGFSPYLKYQFSTAGTYYIGISGYPNMNYDPIQGTGDVEGSTGPYSLIIKLVPPEGGGGGGGGGGGPPPSQFNITLRRGSGLTDSQWQVFQQAAQRWEQIIVGDVPDAVYQGQPVDDILIDASGVPIDGTGGILGQAGPDFLRLGSFLPIHGTMEFDTADLASMEQSGLLRDVILHEMGHVLGFGTIWDLKGLLSGAGGPNPRFTGSQATQQYRAIFNTNETSVPVENTGGGGTRDSHWRESVFKNELMTGYADPPPNPLSRITAASMADLGYVVNLNAADPYSKPPFRSGGGGNSGGGSGNGAPWRIVRPDHPISKQVTGAVHMPRLITFTADELSRLADIAAEPIRWPTPRRNERR